jgi:antirestriction protein
MTQIYVASLSDYNAGRLHGVWIDATQDVEDIQEAISAMLAKSTEEVAEEWAIHDTDGFGAFRVSEYETLERVSEIAKAIEEHGDAVAAWLDNDPTYDLGEYDSLVAYVEEFVCECGIGTLTGEQVSENFSYIDLDAIARDFQIGGDVWTVRSDGGVYVFQGQ